MLQGSGGYELAQAWGLTEDDRQVTTNYVHYRMFSPVTPVTPIHNGWQCNLEKNQFHFTEEFITILKLFCSPLLVFDPMSTFSAGKLEQINLMFKILKWKISASVGGMG